MKHLVLQVSKLQIWTMNPRDLVSELPTYVNQPLLFKCTLVLQTSSASVDPSGGSMGSQVAITVLILRVKFKEK